MPTTVQPPQCLLPPVQTVARHGPARQSGRHNGSAQIHSCTRAHKTTVAPLLICLLRQLHSTSIMCMRCVGQRMQRTACHNMFSCTDQQGALCVDQLHTCLLGCQGYTVTCSIVETKNSAPAGMEGLCCPQCVLTSVNQHVFNSSKLGCVLTH